MGRGGRAVRIHTFNGAYAEVREAPDRFISTCWGGPAGRDEVRLLSSELRNVLDVLEERGFEIYHDTARHG